MIQKMIAGYLPAGINFGALRRLRVYTRLPPTEPFHPSKAHPGLMVAVLMVGIICVSALTFHPVNRQPGEQLRIKIG